METTMAIMETMEITMETMEAMETTMEIMATMAIMVIMETMETMEATEIMEIMMVIILTSMLHPKLHLLVDLMETVLDPTEMAMGPIAIAMDQMEMEIMEII